jgi:subtilisin family serine protease
MPSVIGIAVLVAPLAAAVATPANNSAPRTYLVLYSGPTEDQRAQGAITAVGAATIAVYGRLGMAFARSGDGAFTTRMRQIPGVMGVAPTDNHMWRLPPAERGVQDARGPDNNPSNQQTEAGSLTSRQWDMKLIHAVEAHKVSLGSRNVVVGILDTGLDYTHPNLAPNIDFGKSASCVGGVPDTNPAAWADDNGHGTHTAGTIAATSENANNVGIDGVAPNVRLAAVKTGDSDGNFKLEAVVCAFTWAADHHINVTNNSYFSDPWLYHCVNDSEQRTIWVAEKRALDYATSKGVVSVVAAGNYNDNLANPTVDTISPDFGPTPQTFRYVDKSCFTFPSMVPGAITVSSVGMTAQKSYYSSYGTGFIKVTAPGGDRLVNSTENPNGRILSSVPSWYPGAVVSCTPDGHCGTYAWFQGTSMASPHVAGVAALILSGNPGLSPSQVLARIRSTADPLACPADPYYPQFLSPNMPGIPATVQRQPAHCVGPTGNNSFYGAGLVNALRAVS